MDTEMARRELSRWAAQPIEDEDLFEVQKKPGIIERIKFFDAERFKRQYGIVLMGAVLFTLYTILLSFCVHAAAVKQTREDMLVWHEEEMAAYKAQQAYEEQAKSFLTGMDSLNVAVNQAVEAVAPVVARLNTDQQKQTEVGIMIARSLNSGFPNSLKEVAEQEGQWPLYDGKTRTYTQHDWELVEGIIRPFMESGILPLDLTANIVYAQWSTNDLVGRDSWKTTSTMVTWRYHGQ